jgi:AAA family ATP:ADP antiporter
VSGIVPGIVRNLIKVREEEIRAVSWSFAFHFFVLAAYFVIRPIRDTMGAAGGVDNLAWLFTGTLLGMILLHPIYTALVSRMPRQRFVPLAYRFFILNLVIFFLALRVASPEQSVWIGRIFFIWTSVFNLFVVTVFWSFMTDAYRPLQSKRIFGLIAVGGTIGAVSGGAITFFLVRTLGEINLLLVSALLLELAARASGWLAREEPRLAGAAAREESELVAVTPLVPAAPSGSAAPLTAAATPAASPDRATIAAKEAATRGSEVIGGRILDGVRQVFASPYMLGIAALMMFFSIVSTFLYFQRIDIATRFFEGNREAQTQLFAGMETVAQALTAVTQVFLTSRLLKWLGVAASLAVLPVVSMIGFGVLAAVPVLSVVVVFEVLRRAVNFAVQRPTREVLYTVLTRNQKFKGKNLNDTFVYRLGDQTGAWSYTLMGSTFALGLSALAFSMVPFSLLWLFLAFWLGRKHGELQEKVVRG